MSETVLYEEKAPFSFTIKAMLYLTLLLLILLTIRSWLDVSKGREGFWVLLTVTVFMILIFQSFFNMRFRITTEGVEASMPPLSYGVKYSEIEDITLDKPPFWVGWGLRIWGRRIGFISMHKVSVVIKKEEGFFRKFWLSTTDPENFRDMIKEGMKDRE